MKKKGKKGRRLVISSQKSFPIFRNVTMLGTKFRKSELSKKGEVSDTDTTSREMASDESSVKYGSNNDSSTNSPRFGKRKTPKPNTGGITP